MSISESSPMKSSSSESKSTCTTSVPEISSLSTISSNRTQILELKERIQLLKTQLVQRTKEVELENLEKEGQILKQQLVQAEREHLQVKTHTLSMLCEDLLKWIKQSEDDEKKRAGEIEELYRKNLKQLTDGVSVLRTENRKLKQKLNTTEVKMSSIIHENNFLRLENQAAINHLNNINAKLDQLLKDKEELKAENTKLKQDIRYNTDGKTARMERELHSVVQNSATKLERVRRVHCDREKEYGITLTRMQNELEFLKKETERKEDQAERLTALLDQLTIDNKKLYDTNVELRKQNENEVDAMRENIVLKEEELRDVIQERDALRIQLAQLEKGLCSIEHDNLSKSELLLNVTKLHLEEAERTIWTLRKQVSELCDVNEKSSILDLKTGLRMKSIRVCELEGRVRQLEKECAEEREQRENSTLLLIEMSKDMRALIDTMKAHGL